MHLSAVEMNQVPLDNRNRHIAVNKECIRVGVEKNEIDTAVMIRKATFVIFKVRVNVLRSCLIDDHRSYNSLPRLAMTVDAERDAIICLKYT